MADESIDELATALNSVAIHLVRRSRRADLALGVTPARLSALSVLVFGGPRTMQELADAEQVAGPTMSKLVAALVSDGLVRREPDASDRRAVRLSATAAGRRLIERAGGHASNSWRPNCAHSRLPTAAPLPPRSRSSTRSKRRNSFARPAGWS